MTTKDCTVAERVLDAFPAGSYGLLGLLRILDIEESTDIDTAAVECVVTPRMFVNPKFLHEHADTPEKLLMVIMHELHHVLLGHTTLFPRLTTVDNIVFDAVINALLCRMFPGPAYTSFFSDYYSDSKFPECLLRPPANWNPRGKAAVPPGLAGHPAARGVYKALYSEAGADYYELFQALRTGIWSKAAEDTRLIGNHAGHAYKPAAGDPLFESVRDIVEKWPQPPNPIAGRSWSALLNEIVARPVRQIGNREILRNLIVRTAKRGSAGRVRRPGYSEREFVQPWPGGDRRSVVLRALGRTPLSHVETAAVPYRTAGVQPVHVYLDVSGSIGDLKGCLYGAVLDCRALVHERVHLFSTRVQDITVQQLRQGVCHTTGGTSIDCVAEHMRQHGVRRAVLLTDGWVGRATGSAAGVLKSAVLGVALTPGSASRSNLSPFANHWAELKEPRS